MQAYLQRGLVAAAVQVELAEEATYMLHSPPMTSNDPTFATSTPNTARIGTRLPTRARFLFGLNHLPARELQRNDRLMLLRSMQHNATS